MALIHTIGQTIIGDIAPSDDEKYKFERLAIKYIGCEARRISTSLADNLEAYWAEYEECTTKEAQLVRSVDSFECLMQALEYEKRSGGKHDLRDFVEMEANIVDPVIKEWAKVLSKEREAFWSQKEKDLLIVLVLGIASQKVQNISVNRTAGGPGVGKGTQCTRLAHEFAFEHISVGNILREERDRPASVFAEFLDESFKESVIIPAPLTVSLMVRKMGAAAAKGKKRFLIDGFPTSMDQLKEFELKVLSDGTEDEVYSVAAQALRDLIE
ncbi:hypothetical protein FGG08_004381 [Glutinoglossum americanum]|uniref:HD domain-containing protein n=1 Tax=Glutinoglossum americanum TaxID=1670608 RepID=A0A9P8KZM4_9PEZI|nr:hypothetical protein FGG08_004381 [Glutinoglossum americanum]